MRSNRTTKLRIYLCDLKYFNRYTSSGISVPLNIGYIASYTLKLYGQECEVSLFKDPKRLLEKVRCAPPHIIGLSCYHWNLNLDIFIAEQVKKLCPECVVVIGGWNIDTEENVQLELYRRFGKNVDFLVVNEGELGFSNVIGKYLGGKRKAMFEEPIDGCIFFKDGETQIKGRDIGLSLSLENLPSPILNGLLDDFLNFQFVPLIQTSRVCPYSCIFCCSGKIKGRLRSFPLEISKAEIEYIADKYAAYVHTYLFVTDENFGLMERDLEIAEHLVKTSKEKGYPKQIFIYFDKKPTERVKKIAYLLGDINSMGVTLPFQSRNAETLKAIKRRNLPEREIDETIAWARHYKFGIFTELIFGLPYETKKSFLDGVEYLIHRGINMVLIHNLIVLMGSQLYRKDERERFHLKTKYRTSSEVDYDELDGRFICETEEVAVSSSHFSFDDYLDIRKVSLLFWATFNVGYFNKLMSYLISQNIEIVPFFDRIMNPSGAGFQDKAYRQYINDFLRDATSELFETEKGVIQHMRLEFEKNNKEVCAPTRLNPWYTSRLIYLERWFGLLLSGLVAKDRVLEGHRRILEDLIAISENEWIDLSNIDMEKNLVVCEDTLDFLKIKKPTSRAGEYILKLSSSPKQKEIIGSFLKRYSFDDPSLYFNALIWIQPRKTLRYEIFTAEDYHPGISKQHTELKYEKDEIL